MQATCGNCRYWVQRGFAPINLAVKVEGECRCVPPQMMVLPTQIMQYMREAESASIAGAGKPRLQLSVLYPVISGDFPACGQFKER